MLFLTNHRYFIFPVKGVWIYIDSNTCTPDDRIDSLSSPFDLLPTSPSFRGSTDRMILLYIFASSEGMGERYVFLQGPFNTQIYSLEVLNGPDGFSLSQFVVHGFDIHSDCCDNVIFRLPWKPPGISFKGKSQVLDICRMITTLGMSLLIHRNTVTGFWIGTIGCHQTLWCTDTLPL